MSYILSEKELLELLICQHKLYCLEDNGVDNWAQYLTNVDYYIADYLEIPHEKVINSNLSFEDCAIQTLKDYTKF